jgi:hypothetical protein
MLWRPLHPPSPRPQSPNVRPGQRCGKAGRACFEGIKRDQRKMVAVSIGCGAPSPPISHAIETLDVWRSRAPISTACARAGSIGESARLVWHAREIGIAIPPPISESGVTSSQLSFGYDGSQSPRWEVSRGTLRGVGHKLAPLFRSDTSADVRSVLRACVSQDHDFAGSCLSLIVARSIGDQ